MTAEKGPTAANLLALRDQLDLAARAADHAAAYSMGLALDRLRAEASDSLAMAEMLERMKETRR